MCAILNNQVQMISKPVWPVWPCFLIGSQPSLLFFLYTRDLEEPRRKELVTREQLESFTSPVTIHNTKKTLWGDRSFNRLEQISQRHSPDSFQLVQQIYLSQHRRKRAFSAVTSPIHSSEIDLYVPLTLGNIRTTGVYRGTCYTTGSGLTIASSSPNLIYSSTLETIEFKCIFCSTLAIDCYI